MAHTIPALTLGLVLLIGIIAEPSEGAPMAVAGADAEAAPRPGWDRRFASPGRMIRTRPVYRRVVQEMRRLIGEVHPADAKGRALGGGPVG